MNPRETYLSRFWGELRPYVTEFNQMEGSPNVRVIVEAPVSILMRLGRFVKFEIINDNLGEFVIARAEYTEDYGIVQMYLAGSDDEI